MAHHITLTEADQKRRIRDEAGTPKRLFDYIMKYIGVTPVLDVCASSRNKKCDRYISRKEDGLITPWDTQEQGVCWLNPPYSDVTPWLRKALAETYRGTTTVALVNMDMSTQWWVKYALRASEIYFVVGARVNFDPPPGITYTTGKYCSCFLVFRPYRGCDTEPTIHWVRVPKEVIKVKTKKGQHNARTQAVV